MSTKQKPVKRTSLITRVGNGVRRAIRNNPINLNRRAITEVLNRGAVATKSEPLRNVAALVTGLLNLPEAVGNRVNAGITSVLPGWTEEKVSNPRNTWTIDKSNHLARYYDESGKQRIVSPVGTGLVSGNKSREGDNKSPNGTYRLSSPERGETKKGGTMSFGTYFYRTNHTNDNGSSSGVGIHGTGNPLFNGMNISHGCFRVDNGAIEKFNKVAPNKGAGANITIYE